MKIFKNCLEDIINFLSLPKADVLRYKDTLGKNEEHINKIIKYWKPSKSNITEQPCERLMKAVSEAQFLTLFFPLLLLKEKLDLFKNKLIN